jgi:hypothetical protein
MTEELSLTLEKAVSEHPYDHFKQSILSNDFRFAGVQGYHVYCPGIDDHELIQKYGFKKIEGTTCGSISYEIGKSNLIARFFAERYNSYLKDFINRKESLKLAQSLSGYSAVSGRFVVVDAFSGDLNLLPPSLCINILDNKKSNVRGARWFNPITNEYPQYVWQDFLEIFQDVQRAASRHVWLKEWYNNNSNRWISADIFGKRPYTETNFNLYPSSAWHHAKLEGEPYYELKLMDHSKPCGTLFLGKCSDYAIIIEMSKTSGNWLYTMEFNYHPMQSIPKYVVVHSNGTWYTNVHETIQKPDI